MERLLRGTIVAQWVLAVTAGAVGLALAAALPAPLRGFEHDVPSGWEIGALLAGLALWLVSTTGVFLLWRPARRLYAISLVTFLATEPFFGPQISHGVAAALYDLTSMVSGATLALLYASPAAEHFGGALFSSRTIDAPAPPHGSLAAGLVFSLLGALALVGLATSALGIWAFTEFRRVVSAEAEGRAFGAKATDVACLAEAQLRARAAPTIFSPESSFLDACLEGAAATEGFCDGVPGPHTEAGDAWSEEGCSRDADPVDSCASLMLEVQEHCHRGDDEL